MPNSERGRIIVNGQPRKLNWRPDLPDARDYVYAPLKMIAAKKLPQKVDLRKFCSTIEDQGDLGSCTGQSIVGALEMLDRKGDGVWNDLSRMFVYYCEREYINTVNEDSGAYLRDGIKVISKTGVCSEIWWPYEIHKFSEKPSAKAYAEALACRFGRYKRIATHNNMLQCLAEGYPFVFGFSVYSNIYDKQCVNRGILDMPTGKDDLLGGHAVLCVGYDQKSERFIIRNSWGTEWGAKGYFTMPFDYLKSRDLSDDFWTIRG